MKLTRSIFMTFAVFVSIINCSDYRSKEWRDVVSFLNPLATFQPSKISKGHARYFEEVDSLSSEQKNNLKQFVEQLKYARLGIFIITVFSSVKKLKANPFTIPLVFLSLINAMYLFDLKNFQDKLNNYV